ncbi:MAG: AAA family ATPase [Candidatus Hodarchaeota archaeon]
MHFTHTKLLYTNFHKRGFVVTLITNVEIQNFKGIKQCNIEQIRRINFFIGKNDACKSTILESIYFTLMESIEGRLGGILGRRSNVFFGAKELWYNYQIGNPIRIETEFQKAKLIMEIQAINIRISDYGLCNLSSKQKTLLLRKKVLESLQLTLAT